MPFSLHISIQTQSGLACLSCFPSHSGYSLLRLVNSNPPDSSNKLNTEIPYHESAREWQGIFVIVFGDIILLYK